MGHTPSVAVGFWVDAGSRDEPPALSGASHFLEHLLFKGTAERSARDIAEAVEAVGGEMNAFTTKEYTAFYVRLLTADLDLALDVLSDIMWAPALRPEEVEAERQVILEEIHLHHDEPADVVHELVHAGAWPRHPLGHEVLGHARTIETMSATDIRGYFESHYRPASIVVAAAGGVEHDAVVDGIARRYRGPEGSRPPRPADEGAVRHGVELQHRDTEQAHVVVGLEGLARDDEDRYALTVLNQLLGGGMSSRLFQEIREERGLAYSVYSYRAAYAETGLLALYAGTSPARAGTVLDLMAAELDRLGSEGVGERELEVARGHVRGSLVLGLEDTASRMSRLGRSQLLHGRTLALDELLARFEAVTTEEVNRVARRVLAGSRVLAAVGPLDADELAAHPVVAAVA